MLYPPPFPSLYPPVLPSTLNPALPSGAQVEASRVRRQLQIVLGKDKLVRTGAGGRGGHGAGGGGDGGGGAAGSGRLPVCNHDQRGVIRIAIEAQGARRGGSTRHKTTPGKIFCMAAEAVDKTHD